jgi:hypothetical protein
MRTTLKVAVFGGLLMAVIGYLLPGELSLLGTILVGSIVGGLLYISVTKRELQQWVRIFPLVLLVLLTSTWASLCLSLLCKIPGLLLCSINKIRALAFLYFLLPLLFGVVLWFQQLFSKK